MSPQDTVERVLKEIHVAFAKCPTYNDQPDKIIVDRKEFLHLLDRLNNGIFDMMETYEQTRLSRENAEREFKKKSEETIDNATAKAEDVYAASAIYTADALARVRDMIDETSEQMNDMFRKFRRDLKAEREKVKVDETELFGQLNDMADSNKYFEIIDEMNRVRERRKASSRHDRRSVYDAENAFRAVEGNTAAQRLRDEIDIKVNTESEYFKWKQEQAAQKAGQIEKLDEVIDMSYEIGEAEQYKRAAHIPRNISADDEYFDDEEDTRTEEEIINDELKRMGLNRPDEASLMEAVLKDEQQMQFTVDNDIISPEGDKEPVDIEVKEKKGGAGKFFRNLVFGKDV